MPPSLEHGLEETIRGEARRLGFDACRFTDASPPAHRSAYDAWLSLGYQGGMSYLERHREKKHDLNRVLPGVRSVICLAVSYQPGKEDGARGSLPPSGPTASILMRQGPQVRVARYAGYRDYHEILREPLEKLAAFVERAGGETARAMAYVDTGPIMERSLAQRAGLGFVGKHTNVIGRALGNWFFIAEILTTLPLTPDLSEPPRCGSCTRCLQVCPTEALVAPYQLDARRCISYLTIELKGAIPEPLRPLVGLHLFGCDDCLEVCPWNRFAQEGALMKPHRLKPFAVADVLGLFELSPQAFKEQFQGTPMERSKRRGLLRNASVVLGNLGDPVALPTLEKACSDPEPLIAEHAHWAREQILKGPSQP